MSHISAFPLTVVIGLDIGDRITHFCAVDEKKKVLAEGKFPTTREAFIKHFGSLPPQRIVLEAGSQSFWISHYLRGCGHHVRVVDPRRVHNFVEGNRKTDRRDAKTLAMLAQGVPELLGEGHHRTPETQAELAMLRARDLLVRTRTKHICHVRGTLKTFGVLVPRCSSSSFHTKLAGILPDDLKPALQPVLDLLENLDSQIDKLETALETRAKTKPEVARLQQVNGVGPILAMAFVLTVGDPTRFKHSRDVGPWLGLVPRVFASGDSNPQLSISRCGDGYLRTLLVNGAHHILGHLGKDSDLRRYGLRICERGAKNGKKRAVCAVARKLGVLLHRLWVSGGTYEPLFNVAKQKAIDVEDVA